MFEFIEEDKEYRAMYELFNNQTDFSSELSTIAEQSVEGRRQLTQYFSSLITEGIESGDFRQDTSPRDGALALVGFLNGMGLIWVQDPEHFSIKERAENLVDLFLSGMIIGGE